MPNGMYGGVRGEVGDDLTYSIWWIIKDLRSYLWNQCWEYQFSVLEILSSYTTFRMKISSIYYKAETLAAGIVWIGAELRIALCFICEVLINVENFI